jgi:hypothetical protein
VLCILGSVGAIGGFINTLIADEGLVLSQIDQLPSGQRVWRPGFVGNILIGAVAAIALAAMYSPLGTIHVGGGVFDMTINMVGGALLSGIGGARLLTSEVNKQYAQSTVQSLTNAVKTLSDKPEQKSPE